MAAVPYPTTMQALAAGQEVRKAFASVNVGKNIAIIANDLWTLQGYAQSMLVGAGTNPVQRPRTGIVQEAAKRGAADKGGEVAQLSNAGEVQGHLDNFINKASAKNSTAEGASIDLSGIDWAAILAWIINIIQIWLKNPAGT